MIEFNNITKQEAKSLKGVLTDIDDTLTSNGKLDLDGYSALWRAYNAGLIVVPVTGRPAGWCDMIARFWPVHGVIGENGAFYFYMNNGQCKRFYINTSEERLKNKERLNIIKDHILAKYKDLKISSDSSYREADLAIDYCEDVPRHDIQIAEEIKMIFEKYGAMAKISSIHVNGWFGNYDKLSTTKHFFNSVYGIDLKKDNKEFLFLGDSPNDSPLFDFFQFSCGVGNIEKWGKALKKFPKYNNKSQGGRGVLEVINYILNMRE